MLTDFIASYNTAIAQGATVTFINIPNKLQDRIILDKGLSTEQVKNIDQNGIWTKTTFFGKDILISGNVPNVIPGIVYVKDTDTLLSGPYTGWADFIIALMVNTMVDDEHRECIKQRERRRAMSEKGRAVRKALLDAGWSTTEVDYIFKWTIANRGYGNAHWGYRFRDDLAKVVDQDGKESCLYNDLFKGYREDLDSDTMHRQWYVYVCTNLHHAVASDVNVGSRVEWRVPYHVVKYWTDHATQFRDVAERAKVVFDKHFDNRTRSYTYFLHFMKDMLEKLYNYSEKDIAYDNIIIEPPKHKPSRKPDNNQQGDKPKGDRKPFKGGKGKKPLRRNNDRPNIVGSIKDDHASFNTGAFDGLTIDKNGLSFN